MKKKFLVVLSLVLILALSFSLIACNNDKNDATTDNKNESLPNTDVVDKPLVAPDVALDAVAFVKDATLQSVTLPEGFAWKVPTTKLALGKHDYDATYTKDNISVNAKISVEMSKSQSMLDEDATMAYIERELLSDAYKQGGASYAFNTYDKYITILARSDRGVKAEIKTAYLARVKDLIVPLVEKNTNYAEKYTDTVVPALLALGESTVVDNVDLAAPFYTKEYVENDAYGKFAYNLHTLKNLTIPATYKTADGVEHESTSSVDALVAFAISKANAEGVWTMLEWGTDNVVLDIDATVQAILALADYYDQPEVKAVLDKAIAVVKGKIRESGSIENFASDNPCTTAVFASALSAMGIDPTTVKHETTGKNLLDYLATQRITTGDNAGAYTSPFETDGKVNAFSMNDVPVALISYNRYLKGMGDYFNFKVA